MRTDTAREPLWQEFMIITQNLSCVSHPGPDSNKVSFVYNRFIRSLLLWQKLCCDPFHFCLFIKILGNGFFQLSYWKGGGGCNMSIRMFSLHSADISRNRATPLRIVVTCWWNIDKTDVGNALKQNGLCQNTWKSLVHFTWCVDIKTK